MQAPGESSQLGFIYLHSLHRSLSVPPAVHIRKSTSGRQWAADPGQHPFLWTRSRAILSALGFDAEVDAPDRLRYILDSLHRSGALRIAFEAARRRALGDPRAFEADGWASCSLEATPILPPPRAGVSALDPVAVLRLLRGKCNHWRFVFATALVGSDARAIEAFHPQGIPRNYPSSPEEVDALRSLVATEVANGWLEPLSDADASSARRPAPLNVVLKKPAPDGTKRWRLIADNSESRQIYFDGVNFRPTGVNASVSATSLPFPRTPSLGQVARSLLGPRPPSLLASLDVSVGFKRIRLSAASGTLFTVRFEGVTYVTTASTMGASSSSSFMNAVTAEVARALSSPGVDVLAFCDDLLLAMRLTEDEAMAAVERIRDAMLDLGLPPQAEKTTMPSASLEWVGLRLSASDGHTPASLSMKDSAAADAADVLSSVVAGTADHERVAKVVGRLTWFSAICKPIRPFLRDIRKALLDAPSRVGPLGPDAVTAATALLHLVPGVSRPVRADFVDRAMRLPDRFPSLVLVTDASAAGFGIVLFDLRRAVNALVGEVPQRCVDVTLFRGTWHEAIPQSVRSEFACAALAVAMSATKAPRSSVRLLSDSTTVVAGLNRMSPTARSQYADALAIPLALTLLRSQLVVHADHIQGTLNTVADSLSRVSPSGSDAPCPDGALPQLWQRLSAFSRLRRELRVPSSPKLVDLGVVDPAAWLARASRPPATSSPRPTTPGQSARSSLSGPGIPSRSLPPSGCSPTSQAAPESRSPLARLPRPRSQPRSSTLQPPDHSASQHQRLPHTTTTFSASPVSC